MEGWARMGGRAGGAGREMKGRGGEMVRCGHAAAGCLSWRQLTAR